FRRLFDVIYIWGYTSIKHQRNGRSSISWLPISFDLLQTSLISTCERPKCPVPTGIARIGQPPRRMKNKECITKQNSQFIPITLCNQHDSLPNLFVTGRPASI